MTLDLPFCCGPGRMGPLFVFLSNSSLMRFFIAIYAIYAVFGTDFKETPAGTP